MTPERWRRVESLYNATIERPADERPFALAAACHGDAALQAEVQSLLDQAQREAGFLQVPPLQIAARLLTSGGRSLVGRHVGPFEVQALLGAGGMGEVYRARDTRLQREVAIKILSAAFRDDPERVARFGREARVLASLNHPHIGAVYGLEEVDGGKALVMELVDGENLAQRLARGSLPMADVMEIARQVAAALEAAHARGVVHRDLKPANVRRRPDGTVKVLDFGLARLVAATEHPPGQSPPATEIGAIVGTPAYMSPEQARGEAADTQADIWSFGVLLFEMLTGVSPFGRATTADTLVSVVGEAPDYSRLPSDTPPAIRQLVRRCLERDRARRLQHIGDARIEIEDAASGSVLEVVAPRARPRFAFAAVAAAGGAAALLALAVWFRPEGVVSDETMRLMVTLPPGVSVARGPGLGSSVAVSPDGSTLVIAGTGRDGPRLYSRPRDRFDAAPLPGTERATSPFFSWDGSWIGFLADGRLKRVPAAGGTPVDIAAIAGAFAGASWGPDDRIVFASGGDGQFRIVDARGGEAQPVPGVTSGYFPQFLPDGKSLLFQSAGGQVYIHDLATASQRQLLPGRSPRYADGHIIVARDLSLLAAPLDLSRRELVGPAIPIVDSVARDPSPASGLRHYAIGRDGTLAYVPGASTHALVFVGADGGERVIADGQRSFQNPQFSPDGRRVVVAATRRPGDAADLWIHELDTGTATRLTFDGGRAPVWTPDGASVTYAHSLKGRGGIYTKGADGLGDVTQLVPLPMFHWLVGWTPDGRTLVYGAMEGTLSSILAFRDGESQRLVGPGNTWGGRLSRDGRWLAYYSLDSGNFEVHVASFPDTAKHWLVAEGTDPAWSPDGSEVYYRNGARLMAARIDRSAGIRVIAHRVVTEPFLPPLYDDYAIHPDGRTLIHVRPSGNVDEAQVAVAVNWLAELRHLLNRQPAE